MPPSPPPTDLYDFVVRAVLAYEQEGEAALARELAAAGPHAATVQEHVASLRASGLLQEPELPTRVGPYPVLQRLGSGGMGTVYLCEQDHPDRRRVAVKVMRAGFDSAAIVARFRLEQRALAALDHRGIATLIDGGTDERGRPFLVMQYVPGLQLRRYCDERRLDGRTRLELFAKICDAVQHAHHKGIVHRDLKPSNVLVVDRDGAPWPVVIDFGVAKSLAGDPGATSLTLPGALLGTPEYMSPEQATHELDVDTRADVYSLGVILYELLTDTLPIARERLRGPDVARVIATSEAPAPSARVLSLGADAAAIAERRRTDVAGLRRLLRGDIDWVTMKALEKDRNRRYGMPAELAADVRRFLAHEPVTAGPVSTWYRLKKLCAQNRAQAVATGLVAATVAAGLILSTWFWRDAVASSLASAASLDDALTAVDELVAVGDSDLVDVPHMTAVRRGLLERSVAFYRRFLDRAKSTDARLQPRVADAQLRLGCLQLQLGQHDAAVATLREGDRLAAALPAGAVDTALRARSLDALSEAAEHTGDTATALAAAQAAEIWLRAAFAQHPETTSRSWLARTLLRRGRQLAAKDATLAHAVTAEAMVLCQPFRDGEQVDVHQWPLLIEGGAMLARRLLELSRRDEALRELESAFELWQRATRGTAGAAADWRLTTAVGEVAAVLTHCDAYERMIEVLAATESAYRRLTDDHPGVLAYRSGLATTRYHKATAQLRNHRVQDGIATATLAEADFTAALELAPDDPTLLHHAAQCGLALAGAYFEAKQMGAGDDFTLANAARTRAATRIELLSKSQHDRDGVARLQLLERRLFAVLHPSPGSDEVRAALADALQFALELSRHANDLELRERTIELRTRYGRALRLAGETAAARDMLRTALDEQAALRAEVASPELWITRRRVLVLELAHAEATLGMTDAVLQRLDERLALVDNEDWIGKLEVTRLLIEFAKGPLARDRERLLARAREVVQMAIEISDVVARNNTAATPAMIASMRANTWSRLADAERVAGDQRAEAAALERVVGCRVEACRGSSSDRSLQQLRGECEAWLQTVVALGEPGAVVAAADRLAAWSVADPETTLAAAKQLAAFVTSRPDATGVREAGRRLVERAIAAGADEARCATDAALRPLLDH